MMIDADAVNGVFDIITGKLEDEGWPKPYGRLVMPYGPAHVTWRRGDKGSALSLSMEKDGVGTLRYTIRLQILLQERYVMIDLKNVLEIWPGDHNAAALIDVLRHFKSVVAP